VGEIASSDEGYAIFATVEGERRLLIVDASKLETEREISLDETPAAIAAVTTVVEQGAFAFQIVSGNNQTVAPNTEFQLSVKAINSVGGPVAGEPIFLEFQDPANPAVECESTVTGADGIGTMTCVAADTNVATPLVLRVATLNFNVTISPTGSAPGR